MIGIVDYGAGNLQSVKNAVDFLGFKNKFVKNEDDLKNCSHIILPGVGAFKAAMDSLRKENLDQILIDFIKDGRPFLGICLGMQLLFKTSYEFQKCDGLGVIDGEIIKFDKTKFNQNLKIPHIGWNSLNFTKKSKINHNLKESEFFYFVHSYHAKCDENVVLAKTFYGYEFVSAIQKDNVFAFQPHPEKSHEIGLKILKNFMEL